MISGWRDLGEENTHTHIQRGEIMAYEFCDPPFWDLSGRQ